MTIYTLEWQEIETDMRFDWTYRAPLQISTDSISEFSTDFTNSSDFRSV